jgi:hypothetical protein
MEIRTLAEFSLAAWGLARSWLQRLHWTSQGHKNGEATDEYAAGEATGQVNVASRAVVF